MYLTAKRYIANSKIVKYKRKALVFCLHEKREICSI